MMDWCMAGMFSYNEWSMIIWSEMYGNFQGFTFQNISFWVGNTHRIHGTGIFTHDFGWFLSVFMSVNLQNRPRGSVGWWYVWKRQWTIPFPSPLWVFKMMGFLSNLPSVKLTQPWKIHHFDGIYQERWWFSWAMLVSGSAFGCFMMFSGEKVMENPTLDSLKWNQRQGSSTAPASSKKLLQRASCGSSSGSSALRKDEQRKRFWGPEFVEC